PLAAAAVVPVELALAALLLFGYWPRRTPLVASATLAHFGAFSVYRGLAGLESFGCFGSFRVNPWITASLDVAMLILVTLAAWKSPAERPQGTRRFHLAGAAYALAGMVSAAGMLASAPTPVSDAAFSDAGGLIILEPDTWIGKPFPLGAYL